MKERTIKDHMQVCIWIVQFYMKKCWYYSAIVIGFGSYAIYDRIRSGDWETLMAFIVGGVIGITATKAIIYFIMWGNHEMWRKEKEQKKKTREELKQYIIKKHNEKICAGS